MALGPCLFWICRLSKAKKYAAYDRFHRNGPYGEIPTEKGPIRRLGFALLYNNAFKINWIGLVYFDYFKLNSRKWENSLSVFQRNSPKYSKLDWSWLKFYGERNRHRITCHYSAKLQTTKQTFTTSKHAIEFTGYFLCHFKVYRDKLALTNRRWMCLRRQKIDDYR